MIATTWLARIDPELLIWGVVVVFTLVSQWARAAKRRPGQPAPPVTSTSGSPAPPARPPPRIPLPQASAQKELEEFLRSLAGMPPQEPAARPEPPPRVAQASTPPPAPTVVVRRPKPVTPPPPAEGITPRRPVRAAPVVAPRPKTPIGRDATDTAPQPSQYRRMQPAVAAAPVDPYRDATRVTVQARLQALRQAVKTDLTTHESLNRAILLREIFDAPLALRQNRNPGPAAG